MARKINDTHNFLLNMETPFCKAYHYTNWSLKPDLWSWWTIIYDQWLLPKLLICSGVYRPPHTLLIYRVAYGLHERQCFNIWHGMEWNMIVWCNMTVQIRTIYCEIVLHFILGQKKLNLCLHGSDSFWWISNQN